jgi:hypothetical protein
MISVKVFVRIVVCVSVVSALLLGGCGKKSEERRAEEMTGEILKEATGKDVDVKMQGQNIRIQGQDSNAEISKTNVWPSEMFEDVPPFTAGKIERMTKSKGDGVKTFNVFFIDIQTNALKNYAAVLKEKGWEAQLTDMGRGGMISAQKDKLSLSFSFNQEDKKGVLAVLATQ